MGKVTKVNKNKSPKQKLQKKLKTKNQSKVNQFKAASKFDKKIRNPKNEPGSSDTTATQNKPVNNQTKPNNKKKNKQFKKEKIAAFGGTALLQDSELEKSIKKENVSNNSASKKMKKSVGPPVIKVEKKPTDATPESKKISKRQKRRNKLKGLKQRFNEMRKKVASGGPEADEIATKLKAIVEDGKDPKTMSITLSCAKSLLYLHANGKPENDKKKTNKDTELDVKAEPGIKKEIKVKVEKEEGDKTDVTNTEKKENKKARNRNSKKRDDQHVLFVGNLPFGCTSVDLKKHFSAVCVVKHIRMPLQKGTDKSKGIAFVEVDNEDSLEKALTLHESEIENRKINVMKSSGNNKKKTHAASKNT